MTASKYHCRRVWGWTNKIDNNNTVRKLWQLNWSRNNTISVPIMNHESIFFMILSSAKNSLRLSISLYVYACVYLNMKHTQQIYFFCLHGYLMDLFPLVTQQINLSRLDLIRWTWNKIHDILSLTPKILILPLSLYLTISFPLCWATNQRHHNSYDGVI